jgi:hypothetical protein
MTIDFAIAIPIAYVCSQAFLNSTCSFPCLLNPPLLTDRGVELLWRRELTLGICTAIKLTHLA